MATKIVYGIIDRGSGLLVTKDPYPELAEFGHRTRLFETWTNASQYIEDGIEDMDYSKLQIKLAWGLLEKVYETDMWQIDCDKEELDDACEQFKGLRVVKIVMECNGCIVKEK